MKEDSTNLLFMADQKCITGRKLCYRRYENYGNVCREQVKTQRHLQYNTKHYLIKNLPCNFYVGKFVENLAR